MYNDELQALDSKNQANIFAHNVVNENAKYMNKQIQALLKCIVHLLQSFTTRLIKARIS